MADAGRFAAGARGAVSMRSLSQGEIASATGQPAGLFLYGPDGRPLPASAFRSPIDYGPGTPLPPRIPTKNYPPREGDYPLGFNLSLTPRQEYGPTVSFDALRQLADLCTYARLAIDYRKKKVRGRRLEFVAADDPKSLSLRNKLKVQIDKATAFWRQPNSVDGVNFTPWIGQFVEEMLVTDATVFFKQRRRDGQLHSLVQVDGAMFKPLIDQWAHIVGYEQIIWGLPATAYPVERNVELDDPIAYDKSELIYRVYNPRVDNVYGTSPLEEIKPIIDVAIRRTIAQLSWYTDGNIPQGFIEAPEGWTTTQMASLEEYLAENFAGDLQKNAQLRVLPHGSNYRPARPFDFTKDEEEAIASQIVAFFAVPKTILISQHARAEGANQSDEAEDYGDAPLMAFLCEFIDEITQSELDCPDIKAVFAGGRAGTTKDESDALVSLVNAGLLTKNEGRAELGRDPLPQQEVDAVPPPPQPGAQPPAPPPPAGAPDADDDQADAEATKAELATWRRFAMKRVAKGRAGEAFEAKAIPRGLAGRIQAALLEVRSEGDVAEVFELAKQRAASYQGARADEREITAQLTTYFEREYDRAAAVGEKRLAKDAA